MEAVRMSAEEPSTPNPRAIRKKKPSIKSLMTWVLILALGFGFIANLLRSNHRTQAAQGQFTAWVQRLTKDNPSCAMDRYTMGMGGDLLGSWLHYGGNFKTSAGRPIAFDFVFRNRLFDPPGRVVLSADGRSKTVPLEDIESGRTLDLKAEFPEAFR
jgi:hypothetical protein